jgi:predicted nucleic acid-binding Zn ribbon protein
MHSVAAGNSKNTQTISLPRIFPHCLQCAKELYGRADKKFCDDRCRNIFNNSIRSPKSSLIRDINKILRKNRLIIRTLLKGDKNHIFISKQKLEKYEFIVGLCTSVSLHHNATIYYCYEYYYSCQEDDLYVIGKTENNMLKTSFPIIPSSNAN